MKMDHSMTEPKEIIIMMIIMFIAGLLSSMNVWVDKISDIRFHLNDVYMKLVIQSTGGKGEIGDNENKIIRRIAKEIVIDKNSLMK